MPWIEVDEPYAAPPRLDDPKPTHQWAEVLEVDRGWAEISASAVVGTQLHAEDCVELEVSDSTILDSRIIPGDETVLTARRSVFERCDLSGIKVSAVRASRLVGCKLAGVDFAGAKLEDVVFEKCTFRYVNLRMSSLLRVRFIECTLDDVDLFDATVEDVDFDGSTLQEVNIDRARADRVDLRGAVDLGLTGIGELGGWLVGEDQLATLMYTLAFAAGLGIEKPASF